MVGQAERCRSATPGVGRVVGIRDQSLKMAQSGGISMWFWLRSGSRRPESCGRHRSRDPTQILPLQPFVAPGFPHRAAAPALPAFRAISLRSSLDRLLLRARFASRAISCRRSGESFRALALAISAAAFEIAIWTEYSLSCARKQSDFFS